MTTEDLKAIMVGMTALLNSRIGLAALVCAITYFGLNPVLGRIELNTAVIAQDIKATHELVTEHDHILRKVEWLLSLRKKREGVE